MEHICKAQGANQAPSGLFCSGYRRETGSRTDLTLGCAQTCRALLTPNVPLAKQRVPPVPLGPGWEWKRKELCERVPVFMTQERVSHTAPEERLQQNTAEASPDTSGSESADRAQRAQG